jgi:hypothetical protein
MLKKAILLLSVIGVFYLGVYLALYLALSIVMAPLQERAIQAYLNEGRKPSIAEIEQFTRMKLPQNYSNLKAYYRVETRDGTTEVMKVKISANRLDLEKALSAAGLFGNLKKNPIRRSVSEGGTLLPWWNPDAEKNVLSGYYRWDKPEVKYNDWTVGILVALPEKGSATLYIDGLRY